MGVLSEKISQLGFSEEAGLLFYEKKEMWLQLAPRVKHIIDTIKPFAFYCINGSPFILFFEQPKNDEEEKIIHRQIWNSQTPIIIIESVNSVKIFNGYAFNQHKLLLQELTDVKNIDKFSFWNIVSGNTWYFFEREFKKKRLDEYLLENIQHVTEKLCYSIPRPLATLLVLRLIFIRYLIDRGVDLNFKHISYTKEQAKRDLNIIAGNKELLYRLFGHLKNRFNGNLFELYLDETTGCEEIDLIDNNTLHTLQLFIGGNNIKTNELVLFDIYDFNIIPIELISNIYERFLGNKQRRKDGAFYTPSFLVDYILKFTIDPYLKDHNTCTVLDPACGSGIFLVETLRRIIERNLSNRQFIESNAELSSYLTNHIYGIDKNNEAINVAIFSLYITLLDYKNPKQLEGFTFPLLRGRNFIVDDFFNNAITDNLKNIDIQFIIGNPPWGSQPGKDNTNNYHSNYVRKINKESRCNLISDYQIAQSFLIRSKEFASERTQCSLIVTRKLLYNSSAFEFRNKFLVGNCSLNRVLELSPVRFHLFNGANAPTAIIFYSYNKPEKDQKLIHQSLKPNAFLQYFQIIVSEKYDTKEIHQSLLNDYDWLWKVLVYGNVLDFHLIKSYRCNKEKFVSLNDWMQKESIFSGAGFKIGEKDRKKDISEIKNKLVVKGANFKSLYINKENLKTFNFEYPNIEKINGVGKLKVYKAPHLLVKRGAKDIPVVAYCDIECCFPNTVFGFVSNSNNIDKLKSLGAFLSSNIISYFTFCLSTQWGIERDEVILQDYKSIPIPILSESENKKIAHKFTQATTERENYFNQILRDSEERIPNFDHVVSEFYDLDDQEKCLIDYNKTVSIPLFRNQISPYKKLKRLEFIPYVNVFIEHFEEIFNEDGNFFEITIHPEVANSHFAAIEFKIVKDKPQSLINNSKPNESMDFWTRFSITKHTQYFYEQKDIINFEKDSFYIIKPNEYKNWHPAIAYLDLGEIIESFLNFNDEEYD